MNFQRFSGFRDAPCPIFWNVTAARLANVHGVPPTVMVMWAALLLSICKVPYSKFSTGTSYPHCNFNGFPQLFQENAGIIAGRLRPFSSVSFPIHYSLIPSCDTVVYNMNLRAIKQTRKNKETKIFRLSPHRLTGILPYIGPSRLVMVSSLGNRIPFFWDMTLRHWVMNPDFSTQRCVFIFKYRNFQGFRAVCDLFYGFPQSFQANAGVCIETGHNCLFLLNF